VFFTKSPQKERKKKSFWKKFNSKYTPHHAFKFVFFLLNFFCNEEDKTILQKEAQIVFVREL